MLGLFGTLNLGARALQTQQKGAEIAGHNIANVNNPAYARQRLLIETTPSVASGIGWQGTGVQGQRVQQIRNELLDRQVVTESSVGASLTAQQQALEETEARLGERIDRLGAENSGGSTGLSQALDELFNAFQSVSASPTSLAERQSLLDKAGRLAGEFNRVDQALDQQQAALDETVRENVTQANKTLGEIAALDERIRLAEFEGGGPANDLRDARQGKLETLAKLVRFDAVEAEDGTLDISIGGTLLVSGASVVDSLTTVANADGRPVVAAASTSTPLAITGGALHGLVEARDGTIKSFRADVNALAASLIAEVNRVHRAGFSLTGSTGADFFTGTNAADMAVNPALRNQPALVQASADPTAAGDNQVALELARLATAPQAALANQSFTAAWHRHVVTLGEQVAQAQDSVADQNLVTQMIRDQREAVSGVSLDEELVDLTRYQKAFAASARLVTTVTEMLDEVLALKG